jgi:predicted DCC family thiol-disulfide oxidoreductase YuxK
VTRKGPTLEVRAAADLAQSDLTVVFYDGVCGLCNRLNRFLLRRDRDARFRFAPLQGELAARTLARYGFDPSDLDTVYVIAHWRSQNERVLARSPAILYSLDRLGGGWRALARVGARLPVAFSDALYRVVARNRYRVFGKFDSCPVPPPAWRERFLD